MADTTTWGWAGTGIWPGFSATNQSNINGGENGLVLDPAGYTDIIYRDADNSGTISDNDSDDGSAAGNDRIVVGGITKTVAEVGVYLNSTMVAAGVTYTVPIVVWVFTDDTYLTRINDVDIPAGVNHAAVSSISLGTWNSTEYSGTYITSRDDPFVCFAAGTLILTIDGPRPIDALRVGDRVLTMDNGFRPIRWISQSTVRAAGDLASVRILAGTLGNDRDLWVSPDHRMLVSDWRAEVMFGETEVLVAAKHLVNGRTIRIDPRPEITYCHILFDDHEIVFAEGARSESFHPGHIGMGRLPEEARAEILSLFPDLTENTGTARLCLKRHEAAML